MLPSPETKRFQNDQKKAQQQGLLSTSAKQAVRPKLPTNLGGVSRPLPGGPGQAPEQFSAVREAQEALPPLDLNSIQGSSSGPLPLEAPATPSVDFEAVEREVAMEQLLSSPQVQESVARAKLKQYFRQRSGNYAPVDPALELGSEVLNDLRKLM